MTKKLFKTKLIEVCRLLIEDFLKGQGIVESVVAVGILMMVLTGTVLLISFGLSNRRTGFDRRKANELATLVTEEQVSISKADPENFWNLQNIATTTNSNFPGYSYTIKFTEQGDPGCKSEINDCALMIVNIGWSGKETQNLKFERFFSR